MAVFGLDFTSLVIVYCNASIFPLMVVVICLVFFIVVDLCSTLHVYHAYFYLNLYIYCTCEEKSRQKRGVADV